jgi:hypothetical protein
MDLQGTGPSERAGTRRHPHRLFWHAWRLKFASAALVLIPALAVALPAEAKKDAPVYPVLSQSQQPGSVLVFPLQIPGIVTVDGYTAPISHFEVGVVCPTNNVGPCPQMDKIKIHFHWVCPQAFESSSEVCPETDFDAYQTVGGKLVFNSAGVFDAAEGDNFSAPVPPCLSSVNHGIGFLIAYVVNTSDQPIAFNGLIGNGVIRPGAVTSGFTGTTEGLATYSAIPIQADPALAVGALVTVGANGALPFDGEAGDYTLVTGQLDGDVKYDDSVGAPISGFGAPPTESWLVLLTLDVNSGNPNEPTAVSIDFFNENEFYISTRLQFICFGFAELLSIDPNLTFIGMGTQRGLFITNQAENVVTGAPVTLLGVEFTLENPTGSPPSRAYIFGTTNNSVGIPTVYVTNDFFPRPHR